MRWDPETHDRDLRIDRDTRWEFDSPEDHMRFDMEIAFANGANAPDSAQWWSAHLFRLMPHADEDNLAKLALGFPEHVATYRHYWRGESNG
jgi:hypothetical protein